jgi:hypothetical protein
MRWEVSALAIKVIDSAAAMGHSTLDSIHQRTLTILARTDCNKSFIINFLSSSLERNYLCKYIIDSISA